MPRCWAGRRRRRAFPRRRGRVRYRGSAAGWRPPADKLDRWDSEERHDRLGARDRRHPEQRAHRTAHSPTPHQDEALATLRELVGELGRHAAAERMAQYRGAVDLEHAQEVPHPVGIARHRVVGPGLLGTTVAEQVRRDDGVMLGQLLEDGAPAVRAVADAVDRGAAPAQSPPSRRPGGTRARSRSAPGRHLRGARRPGSGWRWGRWRTSRRALW